MMTLKIPTLPTATLTLATIWLSCGLIATVAGFFGFFYSPLALMLVAPMLYLGLSLITITQLLPQLKTSEKMILGLIVIWWLLHSVQVLTPETGFDSVWYHLPLAQQTVSNHRFIGDLNFYQSFNPQFSDSIFYLGFAVAGETGTKIIAYLFGMSLLLATYQLSKLVLNRTWALWVVLLVSGFQVVSWQSASFYVDIAKAYWELSALLLILQKPPQFITAGLIFGASLASKLFSILLLPVIILIIWIQKGQSKLLPAFLASLVIAIPYYLFAHLVTGNAFFSLFHHLGKLEEIGGTAASSQYLLQRIISLPLALYQMVITKEYTSPLILLFFPLIIKYWKMIRKNTILFSLTIFSMYQLLLWWLLPPTSVRYTVSGFITATILTVTLLTIWTQERRWHSHRLIAILLVCGILFLPIRLVIAVRSATYLLNLQTKQQYLQQFLDGNSDVHLQLWHKDVSLNN